MDPTLAWILATGLLMAAITLVGGLTLLLSEATLNRVVMPLVALAAGSMIGGALFHMLPTAIAAFESELLPYIWVAIGFLLFLLFEQLFFVHRAEADSPGTARQLRTRSRAIRRRGGKEHEPVGHLVLIGDGIHNLAEGLLVGASFVVDLELGISMWLVAAAHEVPQELGDFAVLLHAGWSKSRALLLNLLSGLPFLVGGVCVYLASSQFDVQFLIPLAAGNFLYIGASDLVPEFKHRGRLGEALVHFAAFVTGLGLLLAARVFLE